MTRRSRALVVDDDRGIATLVKLVLERIGFEVTVASDGLEAIERLSETDFDLVTLDLMMPRLDGQGVIDHLADFDPQVLRRIIVLTAAYGARVDGRVLATLPKPFGIDELVEVIARQIDSEGEGTFSGSKSSETAEVWH